MEEHKIIEDLLEKYKRKYVKVESIDYQLYPFAPMNSTFIGKYKHSVTPDIDGDYLLVDDVVSHDGINKYYKFMDTTTKLEHKDLLRFIHSKRWEKIVDFLKEEGHIFEVKEGIWDNDFLYDNCEFKKLELDFPINYYEETSYFGVKDILLPIDEYIEQIKNSEGYKKACDKKNDIQNNNLNHLLKSYNNTFKKDDMIVVFLPDNMPLETLKDILPNDLNIEVSQSQYNDDLAYISFCSKEKLPDFSPVKNPKYLIEDYLENHNILYIDNVQPRLNEIKKSLDNIQKNFIDKILEDTPYLDTKNLFYMNPMSTWGKRDINNTFSCMKKIESDFTKIDEFLNVEVISNSDCLYTNILHDIKCEYEANNFKGLSCLIQNAEDNFKRSEAIINDIERNLSYIELKEENKTTIEDSKSKKSSNKNR